MKTYTYYDVVLCCQTKFCVIQGKGIKLKIKYAVTNYFLKTFIERKFPIDVDMAKKSNNNLDDDSLQSLIK